MQLQQQQQCVAFGETAGSTVFFSLLTLKPEQILAGEL